jgi:hypothetical protein
MSTLLEQASLVMIPSGYKEDTVYSAVPTDGSGDLSFTRASNGTRINSAGLVEVCPWNLVQNSENFDAVWTKYNGATVTTDAIIAPNGTTTADLLIAGASQEVYSANMPKVAEELVYTFSCYAKLYNTNVFKMTASDFSTSGVDASFNLSTLSATYVTGATWSNSSASIESVGNGWYRCILTSKSPATTGLYLSLYTSGTNSVSGVYIWGAQANIGSTAKPYFPTTDRLNVPRLTYQNGGGGCPSLLLEKQSTNLVQYSEALSTGANVVDSSTATANVYISPDGTQNAMQFTETTVNDRHGFYQYTSVTAQTYTASIFTKQTGRRYIAFNSDMINGVNVGSFFDLQTISVVSSGSGHTCSIQDFGNGWLRLIITFTVISSGSRYAIWGGSPNGTSITYAGSTSISQTFWGYQLETSSYPTSYIPTTSASATRVADACSKTGISSLIGQTEGTILWDVSNVFQTSGDGSRLFVYTDGNNFILISPYANTLRILIVSSGTAFDNFITISGTSLKIAVAYKANDYKFYVNGVSVGTPTATSVPAMNSIGIVNDSSGSAVSSQSETKQLLLFKTRLTNAELASLTTL